MNDERKKRRDEVLGSIHYVCRKFDMECMDGDLNWLCVTREYAIPECVGCMVKVEYVARVVMYENSANVDVKMMADMCKQSFSRNDEADNCKYFQVYSTGIEFSYGHTSSAKYLAWIEEEIKEMFSHTEKTIKNVLGMERIA